MKVFSAFIAHTLVAFYCFWHGKLRLKGSGLFLRLCATHISALREYRLRLYENQIITIDFRDVSAWYWINHKLGDSFEEEALLKALVTSCKPNDIVWDVGGNCGLFSYLLAKQKPNIQIFFFEPNPLVFRIACEVLQPFPNVQGVNAGLSSKSDTNAMLTVPPGGSACGTLESLKTQRYGSSLKIHLYTGDGLIESGKYPAPDIIKIDTEGHEIDVLKGLSKLTRTKKPKVFFEHISLSEEDIQYHLPSDYKVVSISNIDGSLHHKFDRDVGHNSILIPEIINRSNDTKPLEP